MNNNDDLLVVVDAGHGGTDSGAINGNIYEKNFNLQAATYIYNRLRQLGIPAVMTRTGDTYLPKDDRIERVDEISSRNPNVILVSNHINAGGGEGAEVVYALRNNSILADMILDNIGDAGQIKRKVYQRRLPENPNLDYYYIIRETNPRESVLIEYGFIDNPNDLTKLQNNLDDYAEGVVKAIADYTNTLYIKPGISNGNTNEVYYTVVKGDTLWSIANKNNISVDELKQLNNLISNIISIGQQLKVSSSNNSTDNVYIVQKGDSLWAIANKYGITVNDLVNYNNLNSLTIKIGQELKIPTQQQRTYTVVKGDTLWSIAKKYNTTVDKIISANNLISTVLSIGQVLIIP